MKSMTSFLLVAFAAFNLNAENWPQFRGPHFNGSTTETNLPSKWSRTENVAWSVDLPGPAAATPIVWEDNVFISTTNESSNSLEALCFDRKSGQLRWRRVVATGINRDIRSNFASPTPATDGKHVFFFYGNGKLVAFDLEGDQKWARDIQTDFGEFAFLWTFASSPVLYEGKLFMQVLQRDVAVAGRGFEDRMNESYLLALNPHDGQLIWRHVRPSQARVESREAFTTPIPFEHQGRKELLVAGGDDLTGHDPETGKELWRWGTWNPNRITHWRLVPSPSAGIGTILVCAPKRDPIYAVRAGGTGRLSDDALAWTSHDQKVLSSDVPTPAFYENDFFILSDVRKSLSRVDPSTGQIKWTKPTPGLAKYEASPLVADGRVYLLNFDSDAVVVDASNGAVIHTVSMSDIRSYNVRSSIVASQGQLFIRTNRKLYCVEAS